MSEYEKQRDANILENKRRLFQLGLGPDPDAKAKKKHKPERKKPDESSPVENQPLRRSGRKKNEQVTYDELDDFVLDSVDRFTYEEFEERKKRQTTTSKPKTPRVIRNTSPTFQEMQQKAGSDHVICPECNKMLKRKGQTGIRVHNNQDGDRCAASDQTTRTLAESGKYTAEVIEYLQNMSGSSQAAVSAVVTTAASTAETLPMPTGPDTQPEHLVEEEEPENTDHLIKDLLLCAPDIPTLLQTGKRIFSEAGEAEKFVEKVTAALG